MAVRLVIKLLPLVNGVLPALDKVQWCIAQAKGAPAVQRTIQRPWCSVGQGGGGNALDHGGGNAHNLAGSKNRVKAFHGPWLFINRLILQMDSTSIACFVSDHGFGHATRSAAVMAALAALSPGARFEIFTTCPPWVFEEALEPVARRDRWAYHRFKTDVVLVLSSPLEEDLAATIRALEQWLPFDINLVNDLSGRLIDLECRLVENFTWDSIYGHDADNFPQLAFSACILSQVYRRVDLHIQAEPLGIRWITRPKSVLLRAGRVAKETKFAIAWAYPTVKRWCWSAWAVFRIGSNF